MYFNIRLLAEKINKMERKNNSTITVMVQGEETEEFWEDLDGVQDDFVIMVRIYNWSVSFLFFWLSEDIRAQRHDSS